MAASLPGVLNEDVREKVASSRILVVGAGGIGCELLKNLVLTGFVNIETIDLDTIDVSNLNRQFLFRKEHVKKSKAEVARESAMKFNPDANIKAYHDSVMSSEYDAAFFKKFDVVMNALDNRAARNHVNRMCLAADRPLIESGTAGYLGQVTVIKKGLTECYECQPKPHQKTFPGCTIRNTPSEPIHCVVWAKHLFNQLFGEDDPDQDVSPDTADPELTGDAGQSALQTEAKEGVAGGIERKSTKAWASEIGYDPEKIFNKPQSSVCDNVGEVGQSALQTEAKEGVAGGIERKSTKAWASEIGYDPEKIFNKVFRDDIKYLLSMEALWKKRRPPTPLDWNNLPNTVENEGNTSSMRDQRLWSIQECADIFANSLASLKADLEKQGENGILVWDKDDDPAMDFVTCAANIRAHIYAIATKTRFDIKSMAGNIIPAIATTNAIIAALIVMEGLKILSGKIDKCKSIYLNRQPNPRKKLLIPCALDKPNPKCYVCASKPEVTVGLDVNKFTVKSLEEKVLKVCLGMVAPDVEIDDLKGTILISSEEGETEENNEKFLSEFGIKTGTILKCDDFLQDYSLHIIIAHEEKLPDDEEFAIAGDLSELEAKPEEKPNGKEANGTMEQGPEEPEDLDDLMVVEDEEEEQEEVVPGKKRKLNESDSEPSAKKQKIDGAIDNSVDDDIIVL